MLSKKGNGRYLIMYGLMTAMLIAIVVWLVLRCGQPSLAERLYAGSAPFESGWHTAQGEAVDLSRLQKQEGTQAGETFSVYCALPEQLKDGTSLFFRSKNIFYSVWIGGEPVYEPEIPQSLFYTDSFGTRWNSIPLSPRQAGQEIEIRVTWVYSSRRSCIDHIRLGDSGGMVLHTVQERLVSFITCVLLLFTGLLLAVADIPVNLLLRKKHELLFLGLFAISIAVWCLSETNLIQLYFDDSRMMQVVSCCALMLIPIPMTLYVDAAFGFRFKRAVPILCGLSVCEFIFCWGLHFLRIADIHKTLTCTHVLLCGCAAVLLHAIIRTSFLNGRKEKLNIYHLLRAIGLCGLSVATCVDIFRYYRGSGGDNALFVRIGILIFILCYGSSSLENTINAVKLGIRAEMVSRLAYQDGLTGIGNRTAFEERMAALAAGKGEELVVEVVMFDVNDLKYVNDNLGHHYGDEMLIKSAELIRDAFEKYGGECFRIGGDEFVVLLSGENVAERHKAALEDFQAGVQRHNHEPDIDFRISIACGSAVCGLDAADKSLMDAYQQADKRMYENKKAMKASQSRPEEYYKHVRRKAAPSPPPAPSGRYGGDRR